MDRIFNVDLEFVYLFHLLEYKMPDEYGISAGNDKTVRFYNYFSDTEITLDSLAECYGITKQALSKRLSTVRERLKKYIIRHENNV